MQSQRHSQVLLSAVPPRQTCAHHWPYPAPERCPVLCALTPFLPSVCCSALTLCVLPCSCAPTATLSQSKLCRRRAACRAPHALRPADTGRKPRAKRPAYDSGALIRKIWGPLPAAKIARLWHCPLGRERQKSVQFDRGKIAAQVIDQHKSKPYTFLSFPFQRTKYLFQCFRNKSVSFLSELAPRYAAA